MLASKTYGSSASFYYASSRIPVGSLRREYKLIRNCFRIPSHRSNAPIIIWLFITCNLLLPQKHSMVVSALLGFTSCAHPPRSNKEENTTYSQKSWKCSVAIPSSLSVIYSPTTSCHRPYWTPSRKQCLSWFLSPIKQQNKLLSYLKGDKSIRTKIRSHTVKRIRWANSRHLDRFC